MAKRFKGNIERLVSRSKNEIRRLIKDQPLGGDQSRSMSLGVNDPRHRAGPDAAALTGQRYNPEQFWVGDDGRLNIRREAVKTLLLEEGERDTGGGGGSNIIHCHWRRNPSDTGDIVSDSSGTSDIVGQIPRVNALNEYVIWTAAVPSNGDFTAAWTLYVGWVPAGAAATTFTFTIYVYGLEVGYDLAGSVGGVETEDASITWVGSYGAGEGFQYQTPFSGTIPANTFNSSSKELWFRLESDALSTTSGAAFTNMWLEYTTT